MPNTEVKVGNSGNVEWLHVVAAVILGKDSSVLLAQRPLDKHQGGKWEFPGGKVDAGESACEALIRELDEELGIQVVPSSMASFLEVRHVYPDKNIFLDVWQVSDFSGEAHGREGQVISWFQSSELNSLVFPEANTPIIEALLKDQG